ncbi:hypothetical protein HG1285_13142 [Hydrogenivirga sp. 128-5-R1-1]|nr:hypothetical protein HG1285_13142 [Hydrogenivirga sp. 128-5-R1-1]
MSDLVLVLLVYIFELLGEEKIMSHRLRNGSFRGLLSSAGAIPFEEQKEQERAKVELRRMW